MPSDEVERTCAELLEVTSRIEEALERMDAHLLEHLSRQHLEAMEALERMGLPDDPASKKWMEIMAGQVQELIPRLEEHRTRVGHALETSARSKKCAAAYRAVRRLSKKRGDAREEFESR